MANSLFQVNYNERGLKHFKSCWEVGIDYFS